ncbi:hypothetical protein MHYP_G00049360 [Metynnis hypsauchen]
MAEASVSVDQDQFSCPVCLDLLKDPVTIHCGHSFCMVCINGCWDQEDQRGVYSCPQCRETFTPRPVLRRNNMMAEMLEKLKKPELQASSPAHCYAGPGDVECDFCTGRKRKAIKSCLMCVASLCETHLTPHLEIPALIKHQLVKASTRLQEKICSQHDEVVKIYCRTDQSCICYLCTMDKHKGHDTVAAAAERTEKQRELEEVQRKSQQRLQQKERKLQELKQAVVTLKSSAQAAVEDSERIFTELIRSIEKKRSESFQSLRVSSGCEDSSSITVQHPSFDGVRKSLSDLKERLEEFCKKEFRNISPHAAAVQTISSSEPRTREDFLQYFCRLTLDPNTVHHQLSLSEQNRENQLKKIQKKFQQRLKQKERKLQELKQAVVTLKNQLRQTEELLENLQQEIDDLQRRNTELEQLSATEDHIHFLRLQQFRRSSPQSREPEIFYSLQQFRRSHPQSREPEKTFYSLQQFRRSHPQSREPEKTFYSISVD